MPPAQCAKAARRQRPTAACYLSLCRLVTPIKASAKSVNAPAKNNASAVLDPAPRRPPVGGSATPRAAGVPVGVCTTAPSVGGASVGVGGAVDVPVGVAVGVGVEVSVGVGVGVEVGVGVSTDVSVGVGVEVGVGVTVGVAVCS